MDADTSAVPKAPTVSTVEAEDELPDVTEEYVATLSEEVSSGSHSTHSFVRRTWLMMHVHYRRRKSSPQN